MLKGENPQLPRCFPRCRSGTEQEFQMGYLKGPKFSINEVAYI